MECMLERGKPRGTETEEDIHDKWYETTITIFLYDSYFLYTTQHHFIRFPHLSIIDIQQFSEFCHLQFHSLRFLLYSILHGLHRTGTQNFFQGCFFGKNGGLYLVLANGWMDKQARRWSTDPLLDFNNLASVATNFCIFIFIVTLDLSCCRVTSSCCFNMCGMRNETRLGMEGDHEILREKQNRGSIWSSCLKPSRDCGLREGKSCGWMGNCSSCDTTARKHSCI